MSCRRVISNQLEGEGVRKTQVEIVSSQGHILDQTLFSPEKDVGSRKVWKGRVSHTLGPHSRPSLIPSRLT